MGGPYFSSARSTISMARSTPAQKPRGWASTTRITSPRRRVPTGPASASALYEHASPPTQSVAQQLSLRGRGGRRSDKAPLRQGAAAIPRLPKIVLPNARVPYLFHREIGNFGENRQ